MQLSLLGLLLLTQPLHLSEQHTRADMEFISDNEYISENPSDSTIYASIISDFSPYYVQSVTLNDMISQVQRVSY